MVSAGAVQLCSYNDRPSLPVGLISAAAVMTLADVLYTAPRLIELLSPGSVAAILATCKHVRETLQETIISIHIPGSSQDLHEGCHQLAHGHWPRLQHLCLMHLQLDTPCVAQLALANWPKLQSLNMSGTHLGDTDLSALIGNSWRQLSSLDISKSPVSAAMVRSLACCNWRLLQHLNLAQTELEADAMAELCKADWPMLISLNISHNPLPPSFTAHLANAN